MKKSVFFALCLTLLLCAPAWSMDLGEGFLGYRWKQDISKDQGFELKHSGGIIDYYTAKGKRFSISEVDSAYVVFGAILNQLYAVFVGIETESGYQRAKDYLLSRFGNPKVKQQGKVLEYSWTKYNLSVRIKLKKDEATGEMKMAFYYLPLAKGSRPGLDKALKELPSFSWQEPTTTPEAIPLLRF